MSFSSCKSETLSLGNPIYYVDKGTAGRYEPKTPLLVFLSLFIFCCVAKQGFSSRFLLFFLHFFYCLLFHLLFLIRLSCHTIHNCCHMKITHTVHRSSICCPLKSKLFVPYAAIVRSFVRSSFFATAIFLAPDLVTLPLARQLGEVHGESKVEVLGARVLGVGLQRELERGHLLREERGSKLRN